MVNVVNPTAGLLAGDVVRCDIQVESGARLLLTTPSANRAHCMRNGYARVEQRFRVAAGGWLENWPELFIPQAGTRYRQDTTIQVEPGATLMFWELLAPGRVAFGEAFAFTELEWTTLISFGEALTARERYRLAADEPSVEALRTQFPAAYYGSGFIFAPKLNHDSRVWREIHELHDSDTWIACSALAHGGWSIRVIAGDSVRFRKTLAVIRRALYSAQAEPIPNLRRAGL
ncbi:urease accessory protein UreD [Verrucomicrobiota bacterium sgz303538]